MVSAEPFLFQVFILGKHHRSSGVIEPSFFPACSAIFLILNRNSKLAFFPNLCTAVEIRNLHCFWLKFPWFPASHNRSLLLHILKYWIWSSCEWSELYCASWGRRPYLTALCSGEPTFTPGFISSTIAASSLVLLLDYWKLRGDRI